jgi:hypothetical protein
VRTFIPTYSLPVEYGKTYLLRIVNSVMNEEMFFGIAQHNIRVFFVRWAIEQEGLRWRKVTDALSSPIKP